MKDSCIMKKWLRSIENTWKNTQTFSNNTISSCNHIYHIFAWGNTIRILHQPMIAHSCNPFWAWNYIHLENQVGSAHSQEDGKPFQCKTAGRNNGKKCRPLAPFETTAPSVGAARCCYLIQSCVFFNSMWFQMSSLRIRTHRTEIHTCIVLYLL